MSTSSHGVGQKSFRSPTVLIFSTVGCAEQCFLHIAGPVLEEMRYLFLDSPRCPLFLVVG